MSGKEEKWVFTGKGPEGKRYFRKIKIRKPSPEDPTNLQPYEDLPPQKPPEVIKEEIKDAQIDDWHKRTDI